MKRFFFDGMNLKVVFIALICSAVLTGCKDGKGYKTKSGLIFYVYGEENRDSTLSVGSILKMNVKKYVNDYLVKDTYHRFPEYEKVMPGSFYPYEAGEIFPFFKEGDSVMLIQDADSLLRRSLFYSVPSYVKAGDKIVTHFKVLDVFENDSLARLDQEKTFPLVLQRNREMAASRLQGYLKRNKVEAKPTPDTVFIEMIKEGNGAPVENNDVLMIRFTASTLSGGFIGGNVDQEEEPMEYPVGVGFMPVGVDEGILHLSVGDHARLYIPALKAFGAGPPPGMEEGLQDMIFEVEILSKKEEDESLSDS